MFHPGVLFPAYAGVILSFAHDFIIQILFPAYAGVILNLALQLVLQNAFPRLRGGDPLRPAIEQAPNDFSPPTRG